MNAKEGVPGKVSYARLQLLVFSLVTAAFTTIYITQPVLPILQTEFGVGETEASLTISAVIFGMALSNLPLGRAADRFPVRPIIAIGGAVIALCNIVSAITGSISVLIGTRFIQGLFVPCLTTCVAAYLARTVPVDRLNVFMGFYISATVTGGLGGRLLGGFIHPPLHWRYAFVTAAAFLLAATMAAILLLPREKGGDTAETGSHGFLDLIVRPDLLRIYMVAFSAFFVFSSVFNYLPFYLSGPAFGVSTGIITMLYLTYLIGVFMGPLAGKLCNRHGNGPVMASGAILFAAALGITSIETVPAVAIGLAGVCAGFFAIHASAAGSLNRRLSSSRGRANSLYVLGYYLGGFAGINLVGTLYTHFGWAATILSGLIMLSIPFGSGLWEFIHRGPAHRRRYGPAGHRVHSIDDRR
jgi:YNFM family putative membrane transporter